MYKTKSRDIQSRINHLQRKGALLQKKLREWTDEIRADGRPVGPLRINWTLGAILLLFATPFLAATFYLNYLVFDALGFASIELAVVATLSILLTFEVGIRSFASWYWGDDWRALPLFILSGLAFTGLVVAQGFLGSLRGTLVEEVSFADPNLLGFLFPLLTISVELAACTLIHEGLSNVLLSGRTLRLHRWVERGERRLIELARQIDELKSQMEEEEMEVVDGGQVVVNEKKSLLIKILLGLLVTAVLLTWIGISRAEASECRIIALDLSKSSEAKDQSQQGSEFEKNIDAILRIIRQQEQGGQITIVGITDRSFSSPMILLDRSLPENRGLFGERLEFEKKKAVKEFKKVAGTLHPTYNRTDIFGAIALAKNLFRDSCQERKIFLFSDMRHTARGINMEDVATVPSNLINTVVRKGMVPKLDGTSVYVLGVHPINKQESHMESLVWFWREYFKKSNANLKIFSINREVTP